MDSVVKRAKSMTMIKDQSKIKDVLDTQKAIWINLNSTQRVQFKLTLDGQEMGYIANSSARNLKTNRSYNIGVVYIDESKAG